MTDLPRLARFLRGVCSNETGKRQGHRHIRLTGRIAKPAQAHPPKLVSPVLSAVKDSMLDDGAPSTMEMQPSGPVPDTQQFANWVQCWDDVNGGWLEKGMVEKARDEEVGYMHKHEIYEEECMAARY